MNKKIKEMQKKQNEVLEDKLVEIEKRTEVLKTYDETKEKNPQASLVELLIPELVPQLYVTFSRQRDFYETKKTLETDLEDVRKSQSMDRSELTLKTEQIIQ